ncbi:RND multidrug efflux membrane fusion protein [Legionella feeleii]|uniref:RND multidrug efflux membrane fusion protein n=2 Tax=Legionella feeleii TaxID=453 RepID=A0A0W0TKG6_9GAMM|nr:RND multidrug efflux membrane fusion protein [Legionella feeleii]SPX60197.1 RND multidrug efflux membrane fusion protein [Legionella feeleii]STX37547.1 RND multidrug efflux membrane fusion protein [Legionella feeleii]
MNMTSEKKINRVKIAAITFVILLLIYLITHHKTSNTQPLPTPVVIVKKPESIEMAEYITQTGNTVAFNSVNLVARIEGYLDAIKFTDGTFVKKDQELFVIEPQPYYEKLVEAESSVISRKAAYEYTKIEAARQKQMYKENATSLKNVEKWAAQAESSKAEVAKAEANAKVAAINYSYTHVLAPFDGRIGRHLVDVGNLVGNGKATELATIEQVDPLYVYFNLNELDLIRLRDAARARGFKPSEINQIPVYVRMQNEAGFPHEGKLDFVNTGLNSSTGTMQFRALLPNKNYPLLPGLFVQVRIPLTKKTPRLTVPDTAIQYDQIGPYLLLVNKDNYVESRRVVLGSLEQGKRAITKGIDAEDKIIVDGLQNATPGNLVNPKMQTNSSTQVSVGK